MNTKKKNALERLSDVNDGMEVKFYLRDAYKMLPTALCIDLIDQQLDKVHTIKLARN